MDQEIVKMVSQTGPFLTAVASAYCVGVLTRAEDNAAEATVNLGHQMLTAVWRRHRTHSRDALGTAAQVVAEEQEEQAPIPAPAPKYVRGDRNIVADKIGTVISGNIGTATFGASGRGTNKENADNELED